MFIMTINVILPELETEVQVTNSPNRILNLPTLKFRRIRGDMIEVFKIITGKYEYMIP